MSEGIHSILSSISLGTPHDESDSCLPTEAPPDQLPSAVLRSSPPSFGYNRSSDQVMDVNQPQLSKAEPPENKKSQHLARAASPGSADLDRPTSAQRVHHNGNDKPPKANDEEETEDELDPAEQIGEFNWENLADRYHLAIRQCERNEGELMQEFESLMNFFRVWADAGHSHETGRTYSRLRTRMAHVQNSEESLEKKREHYINVVKAFESALELLQGKFG